MTQKTPYNPWQMDIRVRERNLKSGSLTDKELEKNLAALPDLEGQSESFSTQQPALEQKHVPPPAPVVHANAADDAPDDEDDEDDDDDDLDADEAPVADVATPEEPAAAPQGDDDSNEGQP